MCCTTRGCCDAGPTLPSTSIEEAEMTVTTTERETAVEPAEPPSYGLSDRTRRERRLGWKLTAPAVILMLAVTGYPMFNALYLSLFSYRLTDPSGRKFVGLSNYGVVLKDSLWWQDVVTTVIITVVTVAFELVIGFVFAMVMNKIIFGRRTVRTAILLPYGIITVVSALAWKYAFALDTGFVNGWLRHLGIGSNTFDWFGHRWSALLVICLAEIWKTTPFI